MTGITDATAALNEENPNSRISSVCVVVLTNTTNCYGCR